jgi:hypothetical protein
MERGRPGEARPSRLPLTLYDLITAIQDVVGPEDDGLAVATVRHLLRSGRLTGLGSRTRRCPPPRREQAWSPMCSCERVRACKAWNGCYPLFGYRRHR